MKTSRKDFLKGIGVAALAAPITSVAEKPKKQLTTLQQANETSWQDAKPIVINTVTQMFMMVFHYPEYFNEPKSTIIEMARSAFNPYYFSDELQDMDFKCEYEDEYCHLSVIDVTKAGKKEYHDWYYWLDRDELNHFRTPRLCFSVIPDRDYPTTIIEEDA